MAGGLAVACMLRAAVTYLGVVFPNEIYSIIPPPSPNVMPAENGKPVDLMMAPDEQQQTTTTTKKTGWTNLTAFSRLQIFVYLLV